MGDSTAIDSAAPVREAPPVTIIRPSKGWVPIDFAELWRYRELFFFFVWREIVVRYKQTLLGPVWAVLAPFFQMIVFTMIFGKLASLPSDGLPAPIFYYAGLLIWQYFAGAFKATSNSLVINARLYTKVYFPRLIIPVGTCITFLVDFLVAFLILVGMMMWYRIPIPLTALFLPLLTLIAVGTALGSGLILACLNVKYRDVRMMLAYLVQIWMYCTVILPFSRLPESWGNWRYLYGLNPMAGVVEGFRWCLLHSHMFVEKTATSLLEGNALPDTLTTAQKVVVRATESNTVQAFIEETTRVPVEAPWRIVAIGAAVMVVVLVLGLHYFKRTEKTFADIV